MAKKKTNPKKIPRTQRDVDEAYRLGTYKGTEAALIIWVLSMRDCGVDNDSVVVYFEKFLSNVESMHSGYMKLYDAKKALEEEYDITFEPLLKHFGYKSKL